MPSRAWAIGGASLSALVAVVAVLAAPLAPAAAAATFTAGLTSTTGLGDDWGNQNGMSATQVTTGATGGQLTGVSWYVGAVAAAPGNHGQVAVYADAANLPGGKLAASGSQVLTANSWNTFPLSGVAVAAATKYWLVFNVDGATTRYKIGSGGRAASKIPTVFGTWPATFGTPSPAANGERYAINMTWSDTTTPTSTTVPPSTTTATTTTTTTPPTTTTTAPPPAVFPDASNTGVPAGTALTAYTGPSTISTAATVIDGKTLGCVRVTAPGVIIRNSKITCGSGYAVYSGDGDYSGAPLLIEDSEVSCNNTSGTALGEANITARRVNIHGCENGGDINQTFTVEDSYIHDLYNSAAAHTDGLQFASGHLENGKIVAGSLNVTIRHNTIYGMGADGSFGTSAIISNRGADKNVLIENNLLGGGAFTLYCEQGAKGTNYQVLNNAFTRKFGQNVGFYGAATDCGDETQSGNYYYETGQPLTLP
jgi:hypothetical protein